MSGSVSTRYGDIAILTYDELQEKKAIRAVADDGAGATVLFCGTTRDSFKGTSSAPSIATLLFLSLRLIADNATSAAF